MPDRGSPARLEPVVELLAHLVGQEGHARGPAKRIALVESRLGRGTRVDVYLPRHDGDRIELDFAMTARTLTAAPEVGRLAGRVAATVSSSHCSRSACFSCASRRA